MARDLEIRKLQSKSIFQLVQLLEREDGWKKLMALIPKNNSNLQFESKYTFEHLKMVEHAGAKQKRPCSEILLEEWGTSGKKRPDLSLLLELLLKAELFGAAEYVAVSLLKEPAPRRPETGAAAVIDTSDETIQGILKEREENPSLFLNDYVLKLSEVEQLEKPVFMNFSDAKYMGNKEIQNVEIPHKRSDENICVVLDENGKQETLYGVVNVDVVMAESELLRESLVNEETEISTSRENVEGVENSSSSLHLNTALPHFPYSELEKCTANFCEELLTSHHEINEGRKLGTGAFGSVYLGIYPDMNYVAVKKLKRDVVNIEKQFKNEVEALSRYHHPHLLPLLGYSCDGPAYCLVYEYMCNGSLQERLACQGATPVLPWDTRLKIALGTSQGILYLHTAYEKPLIHRDIKSANILLDQNFEPKLGDFGLVRLGTSGQQSHSIALTSTVFGTSAYMAPEAFRGDISVKLDSFSFGVVILELLTGLPPFDEKREGCDLITHVEDICESSIEPLLDTKAGHWGKSDAVNPAEAFYSIALDCLKEKRHRPSMECVFKRIQDVLRSCL